MDFLPAAFQALNNFPQFIVYVLAQSKTRIGKTDKFPVHHQTQQIVNAHDASAWTDAETAINAAKRFGKKYGVGFVFTKNDPFFFLDIDDCLEGCNTKWSPLAINLINAFPGAAVEVSASGRGLHILGSGVAPNHSCKNTDLDIEFYTEGRFVALTGTHASGNVGIDFTPVLSWLVANYFSGPSAVADGNWKQQWENLLAAGVRSEWSGNTDDTQLINRALQSQSRRSAFGDRASFRDLWEADVDVLIRTYPDERNIGYDESSADAALAQHLAFWTGNDADRMRRLMLQSALNREKWEREDYLPRTILGACGRQTEWLCDKPAQIILSSSTSQTKSKCVNTVSGNTFLTLDQQIQLFDGCVYVADDHKILIPGGYLLNPERFRVIFGGYSMPMDNGNERVTRNAWEAFTESQALRFPRANTSCFQPDKSPGELIERNGQTFANLYWPEKTPRIMGDVSRFLWHIEKVIPDPQDQVILLSYLAACVQHKGIKFQWSPLLQGVEGNGKTLFTRCVAYAIGDRYTHFPKASEIAGKFNDWLYGKIFIGVEDIYLFDSKYEVMETLKPMITSERQEIEPKGGAKLTRDICANFLINTNHKDGLRKTRNDRRFAPFYTAQQSLEDLKRAGMLGDYFPDLYDWLRHQNGYAIISEFLHTYEIPAEFNPAGACKRAPITSSTEAAIEQGMGGIEQEIMEAIEQDTVGFKGGWVSSMMLDRLLTKLNANRRIPHNKRRELMQSLGYDWHPALKDGRINNVVLPDVGKPRLYIKSGHCDTGLLGGGEVARAYSEAQTK